MGRKLGLGTDTVSDTMLETVWCIDDLIDRARGTYIGTGTIYKTLTYTRTYTRTDIFNNELMMISHACSRVNFFEYNM